MKNFTIHFCVFHANPVIVKYRRLILWRKKNGRLFCSFFAAVLCYLSAAINFFVSDRSMGTTLLCLGSLWLCLGSVEYNKLKKSAPEADCENENKDDKN